MMPNIKDGGADALLETVLDHINTLFNGEAKPDSLQWGCIVVVWPVDDSGPSRMMANTSHQSAETRKHLQGAHDALKSTLERLDSAH